VTRAPGYAGGLSLFIAGGAGGRADGTRRNKMEEMRTPRRFSFFFPSFLSFFSSSFLSFFTYLCTYYLFFRNFFLVPVRP